MAGAILMFLRLAFGNPHINPLVAVKKQPEKKPPPLPAGRQAPEIGFAYFPLKEIY